VEVSPCEAVHTRWNSWAAPIAATRIVPFLPNVSGQVRLRHLQLVGLVLLELDPRDVIGVGEGAIRGVKGRYVRLFSAFGFSLYNSYDREDAPAHGPPLEQRLGSLILAALYQESIHSRPGSRRSWNLQG
jgi:hypothetical protein